MKTDRQANRLIRQADRRKRLIDKQLLRLASRYRKAGILVGRQAGRKTGRQKKLKQGSFLTLSL
jgi:hypothetical protein